ncbi:polyadenylate-binding protein RBP47 [Capsicum chacoense]|nr:polyadenylate-binding protein RBP47 [Capsicum annuum]KAF3623661.1 Polyadenylate-binding protein RBP47 [Capsicum annuum]KAF3680341.1 Polyadenylate-binding protein RBP47 [Capsicum annuum]
MNGGDLNQQQQQQQHQQQQHHQQWVAMQQYQQQWMAMQYPAAAMAMQQQMMYGQQYMPYYHQQQQQQMLQPPPPQIQTSSEDNKTIWIGDLQPWMDENYLHSCFSHVGELVSVKIIRNKQTGQSERYGFVEFNTHTAAEKVLQSYNGSMMPNAEQPFRLNWAAFGAGEKRAETGSDFSIFVGDLASDVTDTMLRDTFASRYPSFKGAKVVVDANTGHSKGYGFVRFGDESERSRAMTEMNGIYCSSRPMRVGVATPKKPSAQQQFSSQAVILSGGYASNGTATHGSQSDGDSSNTTIFVGGLDSDVTDEELKQSFSQFGEVVSVKIPVGKGCGFVQFSERSSAQEAIQKLNGAVIGKQAVRLSWGRSPANKQMRSDSGNQWNAGGYYGRQNYGGYGYGASQNQDSGMYAAGAAYGASPAAC